MSSPLDEQGVLASRINSESKDNLNECGKILNQISSDLKMLGQAKTSLAQDRNSFIKVPYETATVSLPASYVFQEYSSRIAVLTQTLIKRTSAEASILSGFLKSFCEYSENTIQQMGIG